MKKAQQELAITDFFNFVNENFTSFLFQQWLSQQPPKGKFIYFGLPFFYAYFKKACHTSIAYIA